MGADRAELGGAGTGLGSLARAARLQGPGTVGRADRSGRGCQSLIWGIEGSPHQADSPAQASAPLPCFVCPQSTHAFGIPPPPVPTVTVRSQLVENPPFLPSLRLGALPGPLSATSVSALIRSQSARPQLCQLHATQCPFPSQPPKGSHRESSAPLTSVLPSALQLPGLKALPLPNV